jgi:hypothetical protein
MTLRTAAATLSVVLVACGAEAGWFSRADKLPRPADMVRPSVQEQHKPGNRARHPSKYQRPEWGNAWKYFLKAKPVHFGHYMKL